MGPKYRECLKTCEGVPLIHPIYWDFPLQTIHFPILGNLQMTLPSLAGDAFSWCRYSILKGIVAQMYPESPMATSDSLPTLTKSKGKLFGSTKVEKTAFIRYREHQLGSIIQELEPA